MHIHPYRILDPAEFLQGTPCSINSPELMLTAVRCGYDCSTTTRSVDTVEKHKLLACQRYFVFVRFSFLSFFWCIYSAFNTLKAMRTQKYNLRQR